MKKRRSIVHRMFSRRGWRWLQRATGVHRVHHPRWSFGWTAPFGALVYFEDYGWRYAARDSYHDSTSSGRY